MKEINKVILLKKYQDYGVVNIKKILIFIFISVMFISMSIVSAENSTNTNDMNLEDNNAINDAEISSTEVIKNEISLTKNSISTNKTVSQISIDSQLVKYNTTTNFVAKVTDTKGKNINEGKVVYKINGKTIGNAEVNNGIASLTYKLTNMDPKVYNLSVKYGENSNYLESSANTSLTLLKHDSKITVNNASVISRNTVILTANVVDSEFNIPAKNGKVAFKINGKTVGYANVSKGVAHYAYAATKLTAKMYNVTATFGGNNLLNSDVSDKSFLRVSAIPTRMTVQKLSAYSKTVLLKATVVEKDNSQYLPTGMVVFKINGNTIGTSTIHDGKVNFTYNTTHLARGTYNISAILHPTSTYASSNASNTLTIKVEKTFTYNQVKSAAIEVRNQLESNHTVTTVYIGKSRMVLSEFLSLMIQTAKNVYKGKGSQNATYTYYKALNTQKDGLKTGTFTIKQVLDVGDKVLSYMQANGKPPLYVSSALGNIGFFNTVYTYTRVLDVSTSRYLPETCKAYHWKTIHPLNSTARTIYLTSDVIYNKKTDYKIMNSIKSKLESYGYTVKIGGYGPNSHCADIWAKTLPYNAVQVSIFGGADPGVIYDFSTRSFMKTKENRLIYVVYYSNTSKDITGLSFLKRASDDNYSSSSFKGIAYPDIYLRSYGYDYIYSNDITAISKGVINYIT